MKIYKIRNKLNGLYSNGSGKFPSWVKVGKTWTSLSGLSSHISWNMGAIFSPYKNAEVVEFEIIETSSMPVSEWHNNRTK